MSKLNLSEAFGEVQSEVQKIKKEGKRPLDLTTIQQTHKQAQLHMLSSPHEM